MQKSFRRIFLSLAFLIGTSLIGIAGFRLTEGYGFIDAFYMTVITMSTVGFGTLGELSQEGKLFSIVLITISASTFVYAITTLTSFVIEGEVQQVFNKYRTNKKVKTLSEHIIICGLGRNGREAAQELDWQGIPYIIIEDDEEVIEEFVVHYPKALVVKGDATQEEVLENANIKKAQGLISALSSDAENVFITLTAREMNPALKIVARASLEATITKLKRAGANQVILPHVIGGRKMANLLTRPALVEFVDMITGQGNPDLHLEEINCHQHPKLVGKTLGELELRSRTGVAVIGRRSGGSDIELNLHAGSKIEEYDRLFILGKAEQIEHFRKLF